MKENNKYLYSRLRQNQNVIDISTAEDGNLCNWLKTEGINLSTRR